MIREDHDKKESVTYTAKSQKKNSKQASREMKHEGDH